MQTIKGLLGRAVSEDIASWAKEKAEIIRQPVEDQYADAEKEFEGFVLAERDIESEKKSKDRLPWIIGFLTLLFFGVFSFLGAFASRVFIKWGSFTLSLFWLITVFLLTVGVYFVFYFVRSAAKSRSAYEVDKARISRRKALLEEKLKNLEVLRQADLETLVKLER